MAGFHPELFLNTLGGNLDRIDGVGRWKGLLW